MTTYAGKPTCTCGAKWLPVFVEALAAEDITVRFAQLIGSYGPSAGTHGGGLVFDLIVDSPGPRTRAAAYALVVKIARMMGADATWYRPYNWDGRKGIEHVHGSGTGCPHLKQAALNQQAAVEAGRNGLANNGKDTGPRPLSGRTWSQGITYAQETLMALSDADISKIVNAVLNADVVPNSSATPEGQKANPTITVKTALDWAVRIAARTEKKVDGLIAGAGESDPKV